MLFDKGRKVLPTLDIVIVIIRKFACKRKKKRINGKYFISCTFWSKSREKENSLEYYLQGEQIEEFINLIKTDKSLSKGVNIT